jgi:hypothetical protein
VRPTQSVANEKKPVNQSILQELKDGWQKKMAHCRVKLTVIEEVMSMPPALRPPRRIRRLNVVH